MFKKVTNVSIVEISGIAFAIAIVERVRHARHPIKLRNTTFVWYIRSEHTFSMYATCSANFERNSSERGSYS